MARIIHDSATLSSNPSLNEVFPDSSVVVSSSAGEILNMVASDISAASFDESYALYAYLLSDGLRPAMISR
jgi:hypothetical protein